MPSFVAWLRHVAIAVLTSLMMRSAVVRVNIYSPQASSNSPKSELFVVDVIIKL
jgi:hypothetical protein